MRVVGETEGSSSLAANRDFEFRLATCSQNLVPSHTTELNSSPPNQQLLGQPTSQWTCNGQTMLVSLTSHTQVHDLVATLATNICYRVSYVVVGSMYFEIILEIEGNGMEETVMTPRN